MTVGEYFDNLKELAKNSGAYRTGVEVETDDGYVIHVTVTKKNK